MRRSVNAQYCSRSANLGVEFVRAPVGRYPFLMTTGLQQRLSKAVPAVCVFRMHFDVGSKDGNRGVSVAPVQQRVAGAVQLTCCRLVAMHGVRVPHSCRIFNLTDRRAVACSETGNRAVIECQIEIELLLIPGEDGFDRRVASGDVINGVATHRRQRDRARPHLAKGEQYLPASGSVDVRRLRSTFHSTRNTRAGEHARAARTDGRRQR